MRLKDGEARMKTTLRLHVCGNVPEGEEPWRRAKKALYECAWVRRVEPVAGGVSIEYCGTPGQGEVELMWHLAAYSVPVIAGGNTAILDLDDFSLTHPASQPTADSLLELEACTQPLSQRPQASVSSSMPPSPASAATAVAATSAPPRAPSSATPPVAVACNGASSSLSRSATTHLNGGASSSHPFVLAPHRPDRPSALPPVARTPPHSAVSPPPTTPSSSLSSSACPQPSGPPSPQLQRSMLRHAPEPCRAPAAVSRTAVPPGFSWQSSPSVPHCVQPSSSSTLPAASPQPCEPSVPHALHATPQAASTEAAAPRAAAPRAVEKVVRVKIEPADDPYAFSEYQCRPVPPPSTSLAPRRPRTIAGLSQQQQLQQAQPCSSSSVLASSSQPQAPRTTATVDEPLPPSIHGNQAINCGEMPALPTPAACGDAQAVAILQHLQNDALQQDPALLHPQQEMQNLQAPPPLTSPSPVPRAPKRDCVSEGRASMKRPRVDPAIASPTLQTLPPPTERYTRSTNTNLKTPHKRLYLACKTRNTKAGIGAVKEIVSLAQRGLISGALNTLLGCWMDPTHGTTPFHEAASSGNDQLLQELIEGQQALAALCAIAPVKPEPSEPSEQRGEQARNGRASRRASRSSIEACRTADVADRRWSGAASDAACSSSSTRVAASPAPHDLLTAATHSASSASRASTEQEADKVRQRPWVSIGWCVDMLDRSKQYTPLHFAAKAGRHACVKLLLPHVPDMHRHDAFGLGAVHLAAKVADGEVASTCTRQSSSRPRRHRRGQRDTEHIQSDKLEVLRVLIQHGRSQGGVAGAAAVVNAVDKRGFTAAEWAAERNDPRFINLLLDNGARITHTSGSDKYTLLHWCVEYGTWDNVRALLVRGVDITAETSDGRTACDLVRSHDGRESILFNNVEYAILRHAWIVSTGQRSYESWERLGAAPRAGTTRPRAGSKADNAPKSGKSSGNARGKDHESDRVSVAGGSSTLLHRVAKFSSALGVAFLMGPAGGRDAFPVHTVDRPHLNTALHTAALYRSVETALALINKGVDVNARNRLGQTALHMAAANDPDDPFIVTLLLMKGADVTVKDDDGKTPLDAAWSAHNPRCLAELLARMLRSTLTAYARQRLEHADSDSDSEADVLVDNENGPHDLDRRGVLRQALQDSDSFVESRRASLSWYRRAHFQMSGKLSFTADVPKTSEECMYISQYVESYKFSHNPPDATSYPCPCAANGPAEQVAQEVAMVECSYACGCAFDCPNRTLYNGSTVRLQVFRTQRKGWGLRTLEDIPADQFVLEYVGEIVTTAEAKAREEEYGESDHGCCYIYNVSSSHCVDATRFGNEARYINHACKPNLRPKKVVRAMCSNYATIAFFSARLIRADEELTFDYWNGQRPPADASFECCCRSGPPHPVNSGRALEM